MSDEDDSDGDGEWVDVRHSSDEEDEQVGPISTKINMYKSTCF